MKDKNLRYGLRLERVRGRIAFSNPGQRLRLAVYRSAHHIYVQVIDDAKGHTLASASTLSKELKIKLSSTKNLQAAREVGRLIAERALKAGVSSVVFDRSEER